MGEIDRLNAWLAERHMDYAVLAEQCGISLRTIENTLYGNKPLGARLLRALHSKMGVSLDWLLSGTGLAVRETPAPYAAPTPDPRAERLAAFMRAWCADHGEEENIWLECQIMRAVPEYAEFRANRPG